MLLCNSSKISIPPLRKGFFSKTPHPSGNSNQASYISLSFLPLQKPPPPRKFQSLLWGEYGYFLELQNSSKLQKVTIYCSVSHFISCILLVFQPNILYRKTPKRTSQINKLIILNQVCYIFQYSAVLDGYVQIWLDPKHLRQLMRVSHFML